MHRTEVDLDQLENSNIEWKLGGIGRFPFLLAMEGTNQVEKLAVL